MSFLRRLREFTGQSRLVTAHDPLSLAELGRVDAGGQDASLVAAGGAVWVGVPDQDHLDVIDPATVAVTRQVGSPARPARLLAGPPGTVVVVGRDERIHLLDAASGQVLATSEAFDHLQDATAGSDPEEGGAVLWAVVTDQGVDRLVQLDPTSLVRRTQVDLPESSLAGGLRTDGAHVAVVAMSRSGAMEELVWDARSGAPVPPGTAGPSAQGLARSGDHVWVARDRELQLVSAGSGEVLARTEVPGPHVATATLAFDRLWVAHARERGSANRL